MGLRGRVIGRWLGEGRILLKGILALIEDTPQRPLVCLPPMWGYKNYVWKRASPDYAGTLVLDFQPPELGTVNFFCCKPPRVQWSVLAAWRKEDRAGWWHRKILPLPNHNEKKTCSAFLLWKDFKRSGAQNTGALLGFLEEQQRLQVVGISQALFHVIFTTAQFTQEEMKCLKS